jgi:hypothetical protein
MAIVNVELVTVLLERLEMLVNSPLVVMEDTIVLLMTLSSPNWTFVVFVVEMEHLASDVMENSLV